LITASIRFPNTFSNNTVTIGETLMNPKTCEILSPMPGIILKYEKQIGDTVEEGKTVVILEAMKMDNPIPAPESGASNRSTSIQAMRYPKLPYYV
jgi:biotin carboxyl carrier protein